MLINIGNIKNLSTTQIVGKRIKQVLKRQIKEKKYKSQEDFFSQIDGGILKDTFSKYLNGSTNMQLNRFKEICDKLDCSSDYLLGLSPFNKEFAGIGTTLYSMGFEIEQDPYDDNYISISKGSISMYCTYTELENKFKEILTFMVFHSDLKEKTN